MDGHTFVTLAGLLYFSGRIQALQCHECYYVDGYTKENASEPDMFDESCDRDSTPENRYLNTCKPSSNPKLEISCLRLFINTSVPEERHMTIRGCVPFLPAFSHGCNNWTRTSFIKSTNVPNDLKGIVNQFGQNTRVQMCRCTGNNCVNEERDSKTAINEPCSLTKFTCAKTKKCIQLKDKCDGFKDCGPNDISDEEDCETCSGAAFLCNATKRCISYWEKCDGKMDCGDDSSDEENCESCWSNGFHCNISKRCIPVEHWCNGNRRDCRNGDTSDEDNCVECSQNTFRCANSTKCLLPKYTCDGTNHCGRNDTIEEYNCTSCKNNAFLCNGPSKTCIPQLARCNGENDCGFEDNSDETDCGSCHPKSFHCKTNRTCIPLLLKCNGKNDCGNNDNSDEEKCEFPDIAVDEIISVTNVGTLNITSNANVTYKLFDADNNTLEFDAKKYQLLLNKTESTTVNIVLEISNVTLEDEGNYTLQVTVVDDNGKISIINIIFTVQVKSLLPTFPEFSYTNLPNSNKTFTPGEILELVCVAANPTGRSRTKVTWTWQNQSIDDWPPNLNYTFDEKNNDKLLVEAVPLEEPGRFTCTAENSLGSISVYADIIVVFKSVQPPGSLVELLTPIGGVLGVLLLCFGFLVLRLQCKQQRLRNKLYHIEKELYGGAIENLNPDMHIKEQANLLPFEKGTWEIPRERVKLGTPLGSGAFGLVLKAEATGVGGEEKSTVAVKTVKADADESHFKALVMELKIMANLGKNLHIVNLIGACTENFTKTRELLIVMEFCKYGSLLSYMMDNRKTFINQLDSESDTINPTICVQSRGDKLKQLNDTNEQAKGKEDDGTPEDYYKGDYLETDASSLRSSDLLSWAFQIAKGMDYLASRKILHGDLAARNVLLSENNIAKICDFGYARETFKNYDYQKDTKGQLLPLKWMAIESLLCGVFSSKSDCWSYGILLWEMFTLGNKPYPGVIANEEFCRRIHEGYRMDKPPYAPTSIYQIMMDCWKYEPTERPTFLQIADRLLELMGEMEQKRLHEMSDIYTTLNETDRTTDYLMRMGEPTVFAVSYGQPDSTSTSSQLATPHYGPEPTCTITTNANANARKSVARFATFRPAVPRRQT